MAACYSCPVMRTAAKTVIQNHSRHFQFSSAVYTERKKKVYDFQTIKNLNAWKKETELIFGPVVKKSSAKKQSKKKNASNLGTSQTETLSDLSALSKALVDPQTSALEKDNSLSLKFPNSELQVRKYSAENNDQNVNILKTPKKGKTSSGSSNQKAKSNVEGNESALEQRSKISNKSILGENGNGKRSASKDEPHQATDLHSSNTSVPHSFDHIKMYPFMQSEISASIDVKSFHSGIEKLGLRFPPPVKSILNKTMPDLSRFFLNRWREKMIKELGEEGFKQMQFDTIRRGTNLHANVMEFLGGKSVSKLQIMPENEGHWSSLQHVLCEVQGVKALEIEVAHPQLFYRGVFDCVAVFKDVLCLIDWKTSKQPRPLLKNTYDDPLQIVAYLGAVNANEESRSQYGLLNHGVIVVAYPDGTPAHVHWMDSELCRQYWADWTQRLSSYFQMVYSEKLQNAEKQNL